jgi:membrane associated rhomboid family serine protease
LGVGHAWLLTLLAASSSNLIEGWLGAADYRSVGASTAVFAAVGLLAAHEWRQRGRGAQSWARRAAPLVVGIALLGLLGSGGGLPEQGPEATGGTDLFAHALGFALGAVVGAFIAVPRINAVLRRVPQWVSGVSAVVLCAVAWGLALFWGAL